MANVCIVRHKPYIKSKMHFPQQHNFRTRKNYGNKNIDASLTRLNTCIVSNLKNGETYLTTFNRMYESGEFKGQLKVQGAVDKQTKFLDEVLIYPPYEKTTANRLSTAGMPLDKIRDMLGQVDEKTTLSHIYNPKTEQENLSIMNKALKKGSKRT